MPSTNRTRTAAAQQLSFLDQLAPTPAADGDQLTMLPDLLRGYPLRVSSPSSPRFEMGADLRPRPAAA